MAVEIEKFTCLKEKNNSESVVNYELTNQLDSFATAQNDYNNNSSTKRVCNIFNDKGFSRFTKPSRGISEAKVEHQSTETLSFRCWSERCRLMRGAVNNQNRKIAFTLAEVLITLGIIGVVAAMTLPSLINNIEGKQLQAAFKKGYFEIYQAFELMREDMGRDILPEDFRSSSFTDDYRKYFVKTLSAGGSGLVSNDLDVTDFNAMKIYKTYNKKSSLLLNYFDDGQFVLPDGALILINTSGPMWISIDTNGMNKGPNVYGRDLFSFQVTNEGKLLPVGADGTDKSFMCSKVSTSDKNGGGCAYYALADPNYFKKRYYK